MTFALIPASYVLLLRGSPGSEDVLLHLRRNTGYRDGHWAALAGHVEPGESAREGAVREAFEEGGVRIRPDVLEPLTTMHRSIPDAGPVEQRVDFFWIARDWGGEPVVREPAKNAGMRWFGLDDLPTPCVPHELIVLQALAHGDPVPPIITLT